MVLVTEAFSMHVQGNIVSCTKSQICLWTVNGLLLASTTILITGNFSLLCCAVSEVRVMYLMHTQLASNQYIGHQEHGYFRIVKIESHTGIYFMIVYTPAIRLEWVFQLV